VGIPSAAAHLGVGVAVLPLVLLAALYYLPRQVERRSGYTGMPFNRRIDLPFVRQTWLGPKILVPDRSLVLTDDWWLHNVVLSPLNCADLSQQAIDRCPTVFAYAPTRRDEETVVSALPGRTVLRARDREGTMVLEPR
jgi:hypothetical protein